MKREIPLFIIDTKKSHRRGECDFLVCTDKDSGFIARIDYIEQTSPEMGEDYRIDYCRGGVSARLSIRRTIGQNPNKTHIRTLMKRGLDYYAEAVTLSVNASKISTQDCIEFIDKLSEGNKQFLQEAGSNYEELQTIKTSLMMLDAIKDKLNRLQSLKP